MATDIWGQSHPVLAEVEAVSRSIAPDVAPVLRRWEAELDQLRRDREVLVRSLAVAVIVLRDLGHGGLSELATHGLDRAGALPLEREGVDAATTGRDLAAIGRVSLQRRGAP